MLNAPRSNLLKAIDRWENEGGAIALTEVRSRALETNRTGTLADSGKEPVDRHLRTDRPRKTDVHK